MDLLLFFDEASLQSMSNEMPIHSMTNQVHIRFRQKIIEPANTNAKNLIYNL